MSGHAPGRPRRSRAGTAAARETSRRLAQLIDRDFTSVAAFARKIDVAQSTAASWFAGRASAPDVATLHRIGERTEWSLDYLVFGEGGERRGASRKDADLAEEVRMGIVRELRRPLSIRGERWEGTDLEALLPAAADMWSEMVEYWETRARQEQEVLDQAALAAAAAYVQRHGGEVRAALEQLSSSRRPRALAGRWTTNARDALRALDRLMQGTATAELSASSQSTAAKADARRIRAAREAR